MDAVTNRTPCGRIPNTPLRNARHEAVAHACVQGMTCREAGLAAGYKGGPGLKGNISRLWSTPHMQERIAELAAIATEKAEIDDAWILSRIKQLADCSIANFLLFDAEGKLVLDNRGRPIVDLSNATPEQLRTLAAGRATFGEGDWPAMAREAAVKDVDAEPSGETIGVACPVYPKLSDEIGF